jgi:hypothetical protein
MTTPGTQGRSVARIDGESGIFSRWEPPRRETGPSPHYWEHCGPKSANTLQRKAVRSMNELELEGQKGNPRLNCWVTATNDTP